MEVLRWGYQIPFCRAPILSREPIPFPAYCPNSIRGKALEGEVQSLLDEGAIELAPLPSPGFYSRLFVVLKASGAWRPVIDLSLLNLRVQQTSFKMETLQSVLLSVCAGDWMVSLNLKDAYLQVPMHPESRKFLRFMVGGKVYQFKVLCFGLSTAPQAFTRVMAPVSAILHRTGVSLRRYLDGWLIQVSSREQVLLALETVLQLCGTLGIVVNWEKSQLIPTQRMVYLGVILDSYLFQDFSCPEESREASLNWRRILALCKTACVILARAFRSAVVHDPARPGRTAPNEILPVYSSETLESCRSVCSGGMGSGDSPGFRLVAGSRSSEARRVSGAGVPSARLVVRRLGRGLRGSSRRGSCFRPLGSRGIRRFHQRQGALGNREGSSLVRSSNLRLLHSNFRRQRYGSSLSQESGGDTFVASQFHSSKDSPLGGVSSSPAVSSVHHGKTQCSGRFIVSVESGPGLRVDSEVGGFSGTAQEVAGFHRPVRHL